MYSAKDFGIQVMGMSAGEELCLCPFHSDSSPSASFNPKKGMLYCHVCGKGWSIDQLQDELDIEIEYLEEREPPDFDLLSIEEHYDLGETTYHRYFRERGIVPEVIEQYGVRYLSVGKGAAVFPILNLRSEVKGVMYRYIEGTQRYKMYGQSTPVWPMPLLHKTNWFLATEGAFSAMRIATALKGQPILDVITPIALLGAKANQGIVDVLYNFKTMFLYDNDKAGRNACRKMREIFPSAHSWVVSTSPDDMNDKEIVELVAKVLDRV